MSDIILRQTPHSPVRLAAIETANPPTIINQSTAVELIDIHYGSVLKPRSLEIMRQVLSHPSIKKRHIAVDSLEKIVALKDEDPDIRMARFEQWSVKLSVEAARKVLQQRDVDPKEVTAIFVNTCTGYLCPGIATYCIEELGLSPQVKAFDLVGLGCGGALPNIQLAQDHLIANPNGIVLSIAVEICSATFQMGDDISLLISNAIFGDGAAAALLWCKDDGVELFKTESLFSPANRNDVRYLYKNGALHNKLSISLPKITAGFVPTLVETLLSSAGLSIPDIDHWAIHPGGEKILSNIQAALGLSDSDMAPSRSVLSNYGNMSSPSVLFELKEILDNTSDSPGWIAALAFGAGMSLHGYLLKK